MKKFITLLLVLIFSFIFCLRCEAQNLRWAKTNLNVYIEYNSKKPVVKKAFWAWQSLTKIVKFNYVENENDADITVKFARKTVTNQGGHTLGVTRYYYDEKGYIKKANITIMSVQPETNMLITDKTAYMVALHEAGHALGLPHSSNPNDAMYYAYSGQPLVTANDLNALRQLYGSEQKN